MWTKVTMSDQSARARALEEQEGAMLKLYRCKACGTRWLLWPDEIHGGGWNLLDHQQRPGTCCDNVAMGEQIEHLRDIPLAATPSVAPPPAPCPWTREQIEVMIKKLNTRHIEDLTPQLEAMLNYLAASRPEPPESSEMAVDQAFDPEKVASLASRIAEQQVLVDGLRREAEASRAKLNSAETHLRNLESEFTRVVKSRLDRSLLMLPRADYVGRRD